VIHALAALAIGVLCGLLLGILRKQWQDTPGATRGGRLRLVLERWRHCLRYWLANRPWPVGPLGAALIARAKAREEAARWRRYPCCGRFRGCSICDMPAAGDGDAP
jgi:hypothetical protein